MPATPLPDRPRRLLVRGVNWLGDAVMTTPALRRLRERFPRAHLTLLTPEKLKELWLHHPDLDEVITFRAGQGVLSVAMKLRKPMVAAGFREAARTFEDLSYSLSGGGRLRDTTTAEEAAERVRSSAFALALVLPNSPRSALEAWLARIPHRVGYARPWRNWLLTHAIPSRPDRIIMRKRTPAEIRGLIAGQAGRRAAPPAAAGAAHQIHEYLHLVAVLGAESTPVAPFLYVKSEEVAAAQRKFALHPDKLWLGLNPGAEYGPAKRWPAAHFIAAAKQISTATDAQWLIFGGRSDTALAAEIAGALGPSAHNVAGQTSLRELMALLRHCRVLLTNDTGPMHLAAALGTPVVVPFGSTSPELTGPGLPGDPRHRLLRTNAPCAPCFLRECPIDFRCLRNLAPEQAATAVLSCLSA